MHMYTLDAYTIKDKQKAAQTIHMFSIDRYFSAKTSSAITVLSSIWMAKEWEGKNKAQHHKIFKNAKGITIPNKQQR